MKWISFCSLFCAASMVLFADITDKATDVTFPSQVSFSYDGKQYDLQATGVSTRKKFMVKVYSVAHYIQNGANVNDALQDDKAKQLTMKFVHDAPKDKVQEGYRESFHKVFSDAEYNKNQQDIEKFVSFFNNDIKKGDELVLRWVPGGHIEVLINGKTAGSITNKEFAVGLWSMWLGQKSVVNRDDLTKLPTK